MNKKLNNLLTGLTLMMSITISTTSVVGSTYYVNKATTEESLIKQIDGIKRIRHYILHSKTKKIHIDSCESENKMTFYR